MNPGPDASLSPQAGAGARYRSDSSPIDFGGGLLATEIVDRFTFRSFALWILPSRLSGLPEDLKALESRVSASVCIRNQRMLKTYGVHFESADPGVRVEMSREPRLIDAGLAQGSRAARPSSTVAWLHHLAEALDQVGADHGLAHGAVSPFWVRLAANGTPRLDGISFAAAFADAGAFRPEDAWFSSPARRRREPPNVADDVFGIAALAFWALAGGGHAENLPPNGIQAGVLESLRRSRGLPPTGWRQGWDETIVAGLSATPSLRPVTPMALTAQLMTLIPGAPGSSASRAASGMPRARRLPPWRNLDGRTGDGHIAGLGGNGADAVTDRLGRLQQLEQEVASARKAVETGLRENTLQRARLQNDLAAVAHSVSEVESTRRKFDAANRDFAQKLRELEEKERILSEREQAAETRSVSIGVRESSVVERETSAETKQREIESLQGELQRRTEEVERMLHGLVTEQEQLGVRQRELEQSEREFSERRAHFAVELESLDRAREKIDNDAKNLQAQQERFQNREADVARHEASFAQREQAITTREQDVSRIEAEFAATREKLAAERADINRLVLENKSIVEEAKSAESRLEATRLERDRIERELGELSADLATYKQALERREASVNELETTLQRREQAIARRETMFEALGVALQAGGEPADTEKLIVDLIARQRSVDERANSVALREAQFEQNKAELADSVRANEQARASLAEAQERLELERSAVAKKAESQTRERKAWEAEKQQQQDALNARAAETEAIGAKLLLRGAVQNVLAETAEPAPVAPLPQPMVARRASRLWPVTAMAAIAVTLVLGFLFFRASDENDALRKNVDAVSKKSSLIVVTDPTGAEVSVGNRSPHPAPAQFDDLPPGPIEITARRDGYREEKRTVVIKAGETVLSDPIVLGPHPVAAVGNGALLIQTSPSGAHVSLVGFGRATEVSPALFGNLPEGAVNFSVRLAGFELGEGVAQVKAHKVTHVEFTLRVPRARPAVGGISVSTNPEDATVEIGGRAVQRAAGRPAMVENLPPGPIKVTVKRSGFEPIERTFEVNPGETLSPPVMVLTRTPPPVTPEPKPPTRTLALPAEFRTGTGQSAAIRLVRIEPRAITIARESSGVRITRPFLIGTTEITQEQFEAVMGRNPSARFEKRTRGPDKIIKKPPRTEMRGGAPVIIPQNDERLPGEEVIQLYRNHPVESVSWAEAMEFCGKLTQQEEGRIPPGAVFRLPTEAEWWVAVKSNPVSSVADWFSEHAQGEHRDAPVLASGDRGVHDLFGNVAEWCLDAWHEKLPESNASDPLTLDESLRKMLGGCIDRYSIRDAAGVRGGRVVAGGSFKETAGRMFRKSGDVPAPDIGFRVVLGYPAGVPRSD